MNTKLFVRMVAAAVVLGVALGTVSIAAARTGHGTGHSTGTGTGTGAGTGTSTGNGNGNSAPRAPALATITGAIQTIDIAKKSVTITTDVGTSVKLAVGGGAAVTRNGVRGSLQDLTMNDRVTAQYTISGLAATTLAASGPAVTNAIGKARSVSFAQGLITVGSTKLQTSANTKISRNGQPVALRQITFRDSLVAHAAAGTNVALDVSANGPPEVEIRGVITAIAGANVTVAPDDGSASVITVVGSSTVIEVNEKAGTLADLQVTQSIEVEYDPITRVAFSITAGSEIEDAEIQGVVFAVNTVLGTVTITPAGGGANVVLTVNASTEIDVNDAHGMIGDIQVGMPVKAEYTAGTLLAKQIEVGAKEVEVEVEVADD